MNNISTDALDRWAQNQVDRAPEPTEDSKRRVLAVLRGVRTDDMTKPDHDRSK